MLSVAYTPAFHIFISKRCRYECDYCHFPQAISPLPPSPKQFRAYLRTAQRMGAWQVNLVAGEGIERLPEIVKTVKYYGFKNWFDYLYHLCSLTLDARGRQPLTPVLDVGALPVKELKKLAEVVPLLRLNLDVVDGALAETVHAGAEHKTVQLRTLALKDVGRAKIPLATGVRVGMGETAESWLEAVRIVNEVQEQFGNVTGFYLTPFAPEAGSKLAGAHPVTNEVFQQAVKMVREALHSDIPLVAEVYHRMALAPEAVICGAFDLGGIKIADSGRFDLDMLDSLSATVETLGKLNIELTKVPVLREKFRMSHRFSRQIEGNLRRFDGLNAVADGEGDGEGADAEGDSVGAVAF